MGADECWQLTLGLVARGKLVGKGCSRRVVRGRLVAEKRFFYSSRPTQFLRQVQRLGAWLRH